MPNSDGKKITLQNLSGKPTGRIPIGFFTAGFEYIWKTAGIEPWRLAGGSNSAWYEAHISFLNRHQVDMILISGFGTGGKEPVLLGEDSDKWVVRDNNTGYEFTLSKDSLTAGEIERAVREEPYVYNEINSFKDADRLFNSNFVANDSNDSMILKLIENAAERALVVPCDITAYIKTCYALGFEKAMETMVVNPDLFKYICNRYAESEKESMKHLAKLGVEAVFVMDSWSACELISPKMFCDFVLPYHKSITNAAHEAGLRIILWNPGNIIPVLDYEAAVEMDAFAFEQPRKRIDTALDKVRKVFGANRCLMGNIDSELLLMKNDSDEIKSRVFEQLAQSGKDAPFIFFTGSPLPSNIEIDAVETMIKSVKNQN